MTKDELLNLTKKEINETFLTLAETYSNKNCINCNNCINCFDCNNCNNCFDCINCINCNNCINCFDCNNCYACTKLINIQYCILNVHLTKEEYFKKIKELENE